MPKKLTGDLAQTSVGAPISITANTTSASTALASPSSVVGIVTGMPVTGTGIPANTTIINTSGTLSLSNNATATATAVALTINAETQVIGLQEWTVDFKLKTADATTTDDAAWESSLPLSASWTAKAKYVYLMGDTSQQSYVRATIGIAQRTASMWNFFPDPVTGDDAYKGMAYIDGITFAAGVGKIVGMDVSLKGTGPLTVATQLAPVAVTNTVTAFQAED